MFDLTMPGMASLINYLIPGTIGLIFLVGLSSTHRPKSKEELLEEEIQTYRKKVKGLSALNRHQDGVIISQQGEITKVERESQLSLEQKDKELGRRMKQIQDLEWELQICRDRARGRQ